MTVRFYQLGALAYSESYTTTVAAFDAVVAWTSRGRSYTVRL